MNHSENIDSNQQAQPPHEMQVTAFILMTAFEIIDNTSFNFDEARDFAKRVIELDKGATDYPCFRSSKYFIEYCHSDEANLDIQASYNRSGDK